MAHMQLREALQRLLLRRQRRERREARVQGLAGRAEPRLDTSNTTTPRDFSSGAGAERLSKNRSDLRNSKHVQRALNRENRRRYSRERNGRHFGGDNLPSSNKQLRELL